MQDIGLRIQTLLDSHFEVYRLSVHEPAVAELEQVEGDIHRALHAICAGGATIEDLEAITALFGAVQRAQRELARRFGAVETIVLDGF